MNTSPKSINTPVSPGGHTGPRVFPGRFYDAYFVSEYGKIEALRSERYGRCFSLVLVHLGLPDAGRDRKVVADLQRRLASAVLDVLRDCDVVGMIEEGRVLAILPETDYFGSLITTRKLSRALADVLQKDSEPFMVSRATFPMDGRGYGELLSIATKRIDEKRNSLWESLKLEDKFFWEIIETLLNSTNKDSVYSTFDLGSGHELPNSFVDQINHAIIQEITRTPSRKGILYLTVKDVDSNPPIVKTLRILGRTATKIFIVTDRETEDIDLKNATPVYIDDDRMGDKHFTFFLSEDSSYAFVSQETWGESLSCFHTSDPYLVEGLIARFQKDFSLQEQLG